MCKLREVYNNTRDNILAFNKIIEHYKGLGIFDEHDLKLHELRDYVNRYEDGDVLFEEFCEHYKRFYMGEFFPKINVIWDDFVVYKDEHNFIFKSVITEDFLGEYLKEQAPELTKRGLVDYNCDMGLDLANYKTIKNITDLDEDVLIKELVKLSRIQVDHFIKVLKVLMVMTVIDSFKGDQVIIFDDWLENRESV